MFGLKSKPRKRRSSAARQQSGPVYAYYGNRSTANDGTKRRFSGTKTSTSSRLKSAKWWRNLPMILSVAAIVISFLYVLRLDSNAKVIQSGDTNNVFLQNINTYQQAAHKLFNDSILNSNKITVNISGITRTLQDQFPELANVSITLPLIGHEPLVYITPSQPALVLNNTSGSYVLNDKGVAIIQSYQVPDLAQLNLPTLNDQSGLDVSAGQPALPASELKFITSVYAQFLAQKQRIQTLTLPALASELDVRLKGQSFIIKMHMQGDAAEQVGSFEATFVKLRAAQQLPRSYFDVRIAGRVYYK